jgi:hypothetical protein
MMKDYEIEVTLKEVEGSKAFAKTYKIALRDTFVTNNNIKDHSLNNHVDGLVEKLKLHMQPLKKQAFKKRSIYAVDF